MVDKKQKTIVIRLDASYERGLGHLYRMITLAKSLHDDNFECLFLIRQNHVAEKMLKQAQFSYFPCHMESSEEEIIDAFFRKCPPPALWIFDILSTDKKIILQVQNEGVPVVSFDDQQGGPAAANLTINAIAGCWNEIPCQKNMLCGPAYAIIAPNILSLKKYFVTAKEDRQNAHVGIILGGSDTHGATVKIAQILSGYKNIRTSYFLGPHFAHENELHRTLKNAYCPVGIYKAIKNLHKALMKTDIVICGGGQTLFELCSMGIAIMALANEEHEEKTISYFSKKGACIPLGSVHKTIKTNAIRNAIFEVNTEIQPFAAMRRKAASLVDGKGGMRCRQACLDIIRKSK